LFEGHEAGNVVTPNVSGQGVGGLEGWFLNGAVQLIACE
jgi:hypothetical protein